MAVVVVVSRKLIIAIVGAILTIISVVGIAIFTETSPAIYTPADVAYNGPVFVPAPGTENFVIGGKYDIAGTGIYEYLGVRTYGTLYVFETGEWVIIDPRGQVSMSGSVGSVPPGGN